MGVATHAAPHWVRVAWTTMLQRYSLLGGASSADPCWSTARATLCASCVGELWELEMTIQISLILFDEHWAVGTAGTPAGSRRL